jgi:chorismate-pyruvate lyase
MRSARPPPAHRSPAIVVIVAEQHDRVLEVGPKVAAAGNDLIELPVDCASADHDAWFVARRSRGHHRGECLLVNGHFLLPS